MFDGGKRPKGSAASVRLVHLLHGQLGQHATLGSMVNAQWFTEGLATYVSGMLDVDYAGAVQSRLDAGFAPRSLAEVWNDQANYPLSGSIVRYIDRRYGRAALRSLLTARSSTTILTTLGVRRSGAAHGTLRVRCSGLYGSTIVVLPAIDLLPASSIAMTVISLSPNTPYALGVIFFPMAVFSCTPFT